MTPKQRSQRFEITQQRALRIVPAAILLEQIMKCSEASQVQLADVGLIEGIYFDMLDQASTILPMPA